MAYKTKEIAKKYFREYYLKNRDKKRLRSKQSYEVNKNRILEEKKKNYVSHPRVLKTEEHKRNLRKAWEVKNRDKINARKREWNKKNRDRLSPIRKEYYYQKLSLNVQYQRLRNSAKERNRETTLSFDDFSKIVSLPCVYCGESEKRIGVDRINNQLGYTKENSTPCCKVCNFMKGKLTNQEFILHIKKISNFNQ